MYVRCQNAGCCHVDRVAYGKTHRMKKRDLPCFAANTKLGTAMIDSIGGSGKVNNFLSTLNIRPVHRKNLQAIERRAGALVEKVSAKSTQHAAKEAFKSEMDEIAKTESAEAAMSMDGLIEDLGVSLMPDASPSLKEMIKSDTIIDTPDGQMMQIAHPEVQRLRKTHAYAQRLNKTLIPKGIGHSEAVDIDKLPDAVPRGTFKPVTIPSGNPTYIIMDLETTDLIRGAQMPHITQVAAVELRSGAIFNHYVCQVPIAESAQRVTGITMVGENDMLANGKSVKPFSWKTALAEFLTWLQKYSNVFLVAHTGRRFDFPVLMAACSSVGSLEPFMCSVLGMIDSLNVLKKLYPDRSSYRQEDIARDELHMEYKAHDAEEDVKCLSKLISVAVVTDNNLLISNSFLPKAKYHAMLFNKERSKNMPSLTMLVAKGVMKTATTETLLGQAWDSTI